MVQRPPEEVFAFVSDLDNWVRPVSRDGERTYHTPVRVGDTFRQDLETQGQRIQLLGEVTGCKPEESLSFAYAWDGAFFGLSFIFIPSDEGTRLIGKGEGQTEGFYQMFEPFINLEINREVASNLNGLKERLESESCGA